ncbi:dynein assembly factor with WDR repeat domains 1 [Selaginella moellendorffii]|nr:dynein assembly factor with WDR repeat domains 1 [Selaginella moellendorffii]|eukprot:XP_002986541.2 dynein assembly factor with WDR repeat domains 1 [Selaginella moellendorffii]
MGLTCKICFESAFSAVQRAQITQCGHVFCQPCATIWFRNEAACPVCRAFVGEISALISLYDQDAGVQVSSLETSLEKSEECGSSSGGSSSRQRGSDRNKENHGGEKNVGEEDDVLVKFVLGKVAERWQQVMVERAKLKVQVAELERVNQKLQGQVHSLHDENKVLKHALGMRLRLSQAPSWGFESEAVETGFGAARPPRKVEENLTATSWDVARKFLVHSAPVHGIAVNPSGNLVATASWDHFCRIYDTDLEKEVGVLSGHMLGLYAVKFSPVRRDLVATVSSDQTCRLWSLDSGECISVLEGHKDEVNGLSFKRGTNLLATASDDTTCIIWDAERGVAVTALKGHRNTVYGVCFQPCGHLIATSSFDYTAKLWDARCSKDVQTIRGHVEDVIGVDIDDSGWLLATGSDDKSCRIWDLRMCSPLAVLQEHSGEVKRVAFSPYGRLLATTSGDTTVRLYDTATFECLHILSAHSDHVFDVAWSPTADFLVTASHDRLWKVWRPRTAGFSHEQVLRL